MDFALVEMAQLGESQQKVKSLRSFLLNVKNILEMDFWLIRTMVQQYKLSVWKKWTDSALFDTQKSLE